MTGTTILKGAVELTVCLFGNEIKNETKKAAKNLKRGMPKTKEQTLICLNGKTGTLIHSKKQIGKGHRLHSVGFREHDTGRYKSFGKNCTDKEAKEIYGYYSKNNHV